VSASGEKGSSTPIATQTKDGGEQRFARPAAEEGDAAGAVGEDRQALGGERSTNQPERRVALALKAQSRIAKVAKSNCELIA
jgi:hypothetical protein